MMLSVMVMSTGATSFSDEDEFSPQYKEAAEVLTGMGVMQGYEDGSYFLPQRNITRAQVATLIYRAVTGDVKDTQTDLYTDSRLICTPTTTSLRTFPPPTGALATSTTAPTVS